MMKVFVVDRLLRTEALGQASAPRAVLARRLVAEARYDVLEAGEGAKPVGRREARAQEHRPRPGTPINARRNWSCRNRLQRLVGLALRSTSNRPTSSDGVPPILSSVQKE